MTSVAFAIALLSAQADDSWYRNAPIVERLGRGPHVLVISDGEAMTRLEYRTGASCLKARDAVRSQAAPIPSRGIIRDARVKVFCVPR